VLFSVDEKTTHQSDLSGRIRDKNQFDSPKELIAWNYRRLAVQSWNMTLP
jgi:hypothetical protein